MRASKGNPRGEVSVYLPPKLYSRLCAFADEKALKKSTAIRMILAERFKDG